MNELISMSLKKNLKIGVFTISDKSWVDIGQWVEYKNTIVLQLFIRIAISIIEVLFDE